MPRAFTGLPTQSIASGQWPLVPPSSSDKGGEGGGPCPAWTQRSADIRMTCGPGKRASNISFYFAGTGPKVTRKSKSQRVPHCSGLEHWSSLKKRVFRVLGGRLVPCNMEVWGKFDF